MLRTSLSFRRPFFDRHPLRRGGPLSHFATSIQFIHSPAPSPGISKMAEAFYENEENLKKLCDFLRGKEGPAVREAIEMDKRVYYLKGKSSPTHTHTCAHSLRYDG